MRYFAKLGDYCAKRGLPVIVTGTKNESAITNKVISFMQYPAIDLAGKTSLGSIAALIKNAQALISNCTGVSHIAAATQTPSIIISMDGEPRRWAPLNKQLHHTFNWTNEQNFSKVAAQTNALLETLLQKGNSGILSAGLS